MTDEIKEKLLQMTLLTKDGLYGNKAKIDLERAHNTPNAIYYYIDFINDLYKPAGENKELHQIAMSINEYLLILYRDSKAKDKKVSNALFESLFCDFPNTQNTNLFDKYRTLVDSSISFKNAINTNDKLILWNIGKSLFEAYNEFLNGLIGYINICAKSVLGIKYNPNIHHNSYKAKLDEFNSLKLNIIFPIFSNIAKPEIRNAFAHSKITFNHESSIIDYTIKNGNNFENKKIDYIEFIAYLSAGTYVPIGYITALCTISVIEYGNITDISLLPDEIKNIFKITDHLNTN
jgi:hypothetical protein